MIPINGWQAAVVLVEHLECIALQSGEVRQDDHRQCAIAAFGLAAAERARERQVRRHSRERGTHIAEEV